MKLFLRGRGRLGDVWIDEWGLGKGRWREQFFLRMFRFQKAGSSKLSAPGLWQRTDRRLMPWRYWMDLGSGSGRRLLGTCKLYQTSDGVSPNPGY